MSRKRDSWIGFEYSIQSASLKKAAISYAQKGGLQTHICVE